jgi:hypothetical protein
MGQGVVLFLVQMAVLRSFIVLKKKYTTDMTLKDKNSAFKDFILDCVH